LNWDRIGRPPFSPDELLNLSLKLSSSCEGFAAAVSDPAKIEGAHANRVLYIFDEAKAIPATIWDAAEGAFAGAGEDTGREAFAVAISTPGDPVGRFHDIHTHAPGYENWWTRHVTVDEAIAAGRVSAEWVEERRRQWGEGNPVFVTRVLGEFAPEAGGLIPLAWIEAAIERWHEWNDKGRPGTLLRVGADIARFGADNTALAYVFDSRHLSEIELYGSLDTMQTSGLIRRILEGNPGVVATVDVIGIGAGVVDRLREMGFGERLMAFNAAEATGWSDKSGELQFANLRAAMFWNLMELLGPDNPFPIALPDDKRLVGDLAALHWRTTSGGRIIMESKDDIRKRIGRSTDAGDAAAMAFWPVEERVWFG